MNLLKKKYILFLLLIAYFTTSCVSKKTFNGTSTLKCTDYNEPPKKKKIKTKWRLVLYKDGKKIGKSRNKGRSRLFKKK